jgi:hypothetical protein
MLALCCGPSLMPDGGFKASAANNAACRKSVDVFFGNRAAMIVWKAK